MKLIDTTILLVFALLVLPVQQGNCQATGDSSTAQTDAVRVFLDCESDFCDFDHFRREIPFVDYVRDRRDAQVHILITTRDTAGGGQEFTVTFIGQREFEAIDDSLTYYSREADTFNEVREGLTQTIKLGLVRYISRTPLAKWLEISYGMEDIPDPSYRIAGDPWDYWIFRIRLGSDLSGEEQQRSMSGDLSLFANRTTEDWKIRLFASGGYSEDTFDLADGSELTSIARDHSAGAFIVKSLDEHWSLGANSEVRSSTYQNHDLALETGPAIEYNLFPYSQSTYRELTFTYFILWNHFDYREMTIFDETSESRWANVLEISYSLRQPFGTVNTSLEATAFLGDFDQHSVELSYWMDVRIVRGFQLSLSASVERIKNQIYLPRGGATDEEVLLRRQELGTDYRYSTSLSLSYSFGSIYNNIVNPRFD